MKKAICIISALIIMALPSAVFAGTIEDSLSEVESKSGLPSGGSGDNVILPIIKKITEFFAGLIGVIAILMIVVSGIMYMTSGGDEGRATQAKNMLTYAVIGLVIALLAWSIVIAVGAAVNAWK